MSPQMLLRSIVVLAFVLAGAFAGWQVGEWWLDRTVAVPELESAVYPAIGAIAGAAVGLLFGVVIWLSWANRSEAGSPGDDLGEKNRSDESGG